MSAKKPLAVPADIIYIYDGSFQGFLCCVFESVYSGEMPVDIHTGKDQDMGLWDVKQISTDSEKAERVRSSIPSKLSNRAMELVIAVFLSELEHREIKLLGFLLRAYREGRQLLYKLGDPVMAPLLAAEKNLLGEAHLLKGFIRFSDADGVLVSTITPKNFVLPFIAEHFILRYREESFIIFDKTHSVALLYRNGKSEILWDSTIEFYRDSEQELKYQALWKRFYNTVAVENRGNPRCRMTHMPKRYWENMLEVRDLL
ncbi:TIGR03915 family putative DNA repair protein [Brucepastera parasyntrophica]|uniref:TIGR03915 family putative DNA repair protein n=1 Tax=Brucepastera parasyntrophica TaxID=2880008 RepID=UPI002109F131|nr:TIGR03915 family putative DNA repair protein [Brucepastera parasyntrophica]ULQ60452.1 TIGR03915 family putative DNA repair protein [Brucepastera parasyntrophica]